MEAAALIGAGGHKNVVGCRQAQAGGHRNTASQKCRELQAGTQEYCWLQAGTAEWQHVLVACKAHSLTRTPQAGVGSTLLLAERT